MIKKNDVNKFNNIYAFFYFRYPFSYNNDFILYNFCNIFLPEEQKFLFSNTLCMTVIKNQLCFDSINENYKFLRFFAYNNKIFNKFILSILITYISTERYLNLFLITFYFYLIKFLIIITLKFKANKKQLN